MDEKIEEDLEPGLIVAEEPAKTKRGLVIFLLYLAVFAVGLSGSLFYKTINYKNELEKKADLVPEKISDLALYSVLSENIAYLFNPKISSNFEFYTTMSETADESIRFLYLALTGLYTEDNTRSVFTSVENYEENFSENTFSVKVRLGFLNAEDGDYHFENLSKEGYFRVESFSDYTAANDYFNKNADKFNAFLFDFRVLDSGVYLNDIKAL